MDSIRQLKRSRTEEEDRISDLPDPILCKILSFLPTKYVVGTSILSKRWNNLFPFGASPVRLDLDDSLLLNPAKNHQAYPATFVFTDFVDKLFDTLLGEHVETIGIYLNRDWLYKHDKVEDWIHAAKELAVEQLTLSMRNLGKLDLFFELLDCTSLVKLVLNLQGSPLDFPAYTSLPNLKTLELIDLILDDHHYDEEVSIEELVKGCPKLEELSFTGFICTTPLVRIHSPVLKKLTISDYSSCSNYELSLDTPNLQVLICTCYISGNCTSSSLKSLLTAHLNMWPGQFWTRVSRDAITSIVTACSRTVRLYMGAPTVHALGCSYASLPRFKNLNSLRLGSLSHNGWAFLAHVLLKAPSLEELIIEEGFEKTGAGYADFARLLPSPPSCLELHLVKIEFCVFNWKEDEISLLEYLLKNGKVLEKLICHWRTAMDLSTVKRLLSLPNNSKIVLESR